MSNSNRTDEILWDFISVFGMMDEFYEEGEWQIRLDAFREGYLDSQREMAAIEPDSKVARYLGDDFEPNSDFVKGFNDGYVTGWKDLQLAIRALFLAEVNK